MTSFYATADNEHTAAVLDLFGATATTTYIGERDGDGHPAVVWHATDRGIVRTQSNGDGIDGTLTLWSDVHGVTITARRWAARSGELTVTVQDPALTVTGNREDSIAFAQDVIGRLSNR